MEEEEDVEDIGAVEDALAAWDEDSVTLEEEALEEDDDAAVEPPLDDDAGVPGLV